MSEATEKAPFLKVSRRVSQRSNWMLGAAWITCVGLTCAVLFLDLTEFAQGVITLVLGRTLGYLDIGFTFEFGSTKASQAKDATIKELTNTAATTASTAAAVAAGATSDQLKVTTDNVSVTAETATLSTDTPPTQGAKP